MDVGLPDIDGREVVRILRKNGFKAPIIMLTGHDTDSDTILGFESDANDYVTKPFRFAVLLARIRAPAASPRWLENDPNYADVLFKSFGGFATLAAMRRASSLLRSCLAGAPFVGVKSVRWTRVWRGRGDMCVF
jgi:DNA-binding response OmpR family regulator